jgi:hypothetical protein
MPPFPVRNQIDADARPGERQPWVTPEIEVLPRKKSRNHTAIENGPSPRH